MEVVPGSWKSLQHTYRNADNRKCDTANWLQACMLVYDASLSVEERGKKANLRLGLEGPKWRCYYPNSSAADYEAVRGAASSGRWLQAWGQRKNYQSF